MGRLYPYLTAGLPELSLQAEVKGFDYARLCEEIRLQLNVQDARYLRLLLMGLDPLSQTPYLYVHAAKSKCRFIREYFAFDRVLRNAQAQAAAAKMGVEYHDYLVGDADPDGVSEAVKQVMASTDILEREKNIDGLRWNKASDITIFNYIDIDALLAFVLKAAIVDRWMNLDKAKGEELFKALVTEVRGTFDIRKTTV